MSAQFGRVRERKTPSTVNGVFPLGNMYNNYGSPEDPFWSPPIPVLGYSEEPFATAQRTVDSVHKGPPYHEGGAFESLRFDCISPIKVVGYGQYMRSDGLKKYVGGFGPPGRYDFCRNHYPDSFDFEGMNIGAWNPTLITTHTPSMAGWGDKAWSATKPKIEKAGGFVFGAELRDTGPMLRASAKEFHQTWRSIVNETDLSWTMRPKKAADHFINHNFGWVPFLSDLKRFDNVIQNGPAIIARLSERNGKWTRRRVTLKSESVETVLGSYPAGYIAGFPGGDWDDWCSAYPMATLTEVKETIVTAVGSFIYYRPEFDNTLPDYSSDWNSAMRHMAIAGIRASPSNIYKAIPWTWAIDWVSNLGDHIDYLSDVAVDSIANKYLYVMQHQRTTRKITYFMPFFSGGVRAEFSRVIESKQRAEGASPYEFVLSVGGLTPRQLAIAVALGVSRAVPRN